MFSLALIFLPQANAYPEKVSDLQHQYTVTIDLPQAVVYDLRVNLVVPRGLIYDQDSLSVTGASIQPSETVSSPNDGSQNVQIEWAFGDVDNLANLDIAIKFNLVVANIESNHKGAALGNIEAQAAWKDISNIVYSNNNRSDLIRVIEPDLNIGLVASSPTARSGDEVTYTISVYHTAFSYADAFEVDLKNTMSPGMILKPGSLEVISGPAGIRQEIDLPSLSFHLDRIDSSWNEAHKILLKYKVTLERGVRNGENLRNHADLKWTSIFGDNPEKRSYSRSANHQLRMISTPVKLIKRADKTEAQIGEKINYTYLVENNGLLNLTLKNLVDDKLSDIKPNPVKAIVPPGKIITFNATYEIPISDLDPIINNATLEAIDSLGNTWTASANASVNLSLPKSLSTSLPSTNGLWINKTSNKSITSPGEEIIYKIEYGNNYTHSVDDVVVNDYLPQVEYIDSIPLPDFVEGNRLAWHLGTLRQNENGLIEVRVKIPERPQMKFRDDSSVRGEGYAFSRAHLLTDQDAYTLTNHVNISGYTADRTVWLKASDSVDITVSKIAGTEIISIEHGSGYYDQKNAIKLNTTNLSINLYKDILVKYKPSTFALPQGRSINYCSKWFEAIYAKNHASGASINERYTHATALNHSASLELDKNGSTLATETSFEGAAHIGLLKEASINETSRHVESKPIESRPIETPIYESQDDYLGSFKVRTRFDEYGKNVVSEFSSSGTGSVVADKRIGKSQRSYESGTGAYQIEELLQTHTNYMAKNINVSHKSVNYTYTPDVRLGLSKKWKEGMWSKSGTWGRKNSNSTAPSSFIGEEVSQADFLNKSTIAEGLNEMNTEETLSGRAQFKAMKTSMPKGHDGDVNLYDEYIGRYKITQKIAISGVARFNMPHLSISKVGTTDLEDSTFVNYVITVVNDGNRDLGTIYVQDIFPYSTEYIYSSVRPSEITSRYVQWTLNNLGIGVSSKIELKLNMTKEMDNLVNQVQARGSYGDQWVSAEDFSTIELNWLSCCQPQILVSKTSYVDAEDPMLIHYRIMLENRGEYTMVASLTDLLPGGLVVLNSTLMPANYLSDLVSWNILNLKPGEVRIIDYLARALQSGTYVNQVHVEAHSVDGTDSVSANALCREEIRGGVYPVSNSNWQPPGCFDLNYTQQGFGEEWIPCYNCSTPEEFSPLRTICPSCCTYRGESDEGYDIP